MRGTIKRLKEKGFGFIARDDGGDKDLFFHFSELRNARFEELREGLNVEFDLADGEKGPKAVNIKVTR